MTLRRNQIDALEYLQQVPEGVTAAQVGDWLGMSPAVVRDVMGSLALRGLVHVVDPDARPHVYRYGTASEAAALGTYRQAVRVSMSALPAVYKPLPPDAGQLAAMLGIDADEAERVLGMLVGDGMFRRR